MDSVWLNNQFEKHPKKSKAGLAQKLGLEPPAISKILKGTRQIKAQEYVMMREYFGLNSQNNVNTEYYQSSYTLENLEHQTSLNEISNPVQNSEWVIPANILNKRTKAPSNQIKIFEVKETNMEPDFKQGESVLVDLTDQHPSPPGAFVLFDGFGYMIRLCEFIPKSKPPKIKISATKQGFQPQILLENDVEIIGRIIAKLQML